MGGRGRSRKSRKVMEGQWKGSGRFSEMGAPAGRGGASEGVFGERGARAFGEGSGGVPATRRRLCIRGRRGTGRRRL